MSEESLACAVCRKNTSLKCGRCRRIAYCSREHQKLDWKEHKKSCGPCTSSTCFKIAKDLKVGRHLVSTRRISMGERIFEEGPLVSGPSDEGPPVCLGCYKLLNRINSRKCSRCNWPVCSRECENSKAHKPECEITAKFKKEKVNITNFETNHPSYRCIIVLRCLYLKNSDQAAWEKVDALESHVEQRKKSERYDEDMRLVAQFIPRFFNYHEFPQEDILRMVGIIGVNAHYAPRQESHFIALYDKGSIMEHSCLPNCSKSFTEDGKLVVTAAREIQEGEHLSISYTDVLRGIEERQDYLLRTKYFVCECDRCSDPTDMGTHFDSFKCPIQGCGGYIVPVPVRSSLAVKYDWQCVECHTSSLGTLLLTVKTVVNDYFRSFLKEINPEIGKVVLKKFKKYLHPNHYLVVHVELRLLKWLSPIQLILASNEDLDYFLDINKHLIDLSSKLTPARMADRGNLKLSLYLLLTEQWRRKCPSGEEDKEQLQQHLLMMRNLLEEAYSLLKTDPELESQTMATQALENIDRIDKRLRGVQ